MAKQNNYDVIVSYIPKKPSAVGDDAPYQKRFHRKIKASSKANAKGKGIDAVYRETPGGANILSTYAEKAEDDE